MPGSGGSQGRRAGGTESWVAASRTASTRTDRSVTGWKVSSWAWSLGIGAPRASQWSSVSTGAGRSSSVADASGRRPPIRPVWNGSSAAWPSLAWARPGVRGESCPESGASMMSRLSPVSVVRSAIRRLVLARMSAVTAPEGRWVARIRWMPRERPRWAMLTSPETKSGSSRTIDANSSMTRTSRAMAASSGWRVRLSV